MVHFVNTSLKCTNLLGMCSWILRTFRSCSPELMITLWKTLVLPILDYCPVRTGLIQQIEDIQKSFTRKIRSEKSGDYRERLNLYGLYSLQRRRKRYRIIYTWKIPENLVPNVGESKIQSISSIRHSRIVVCVVPMAYC